MADGLEKATSSKSPPKMYKPTAFYCFMKKKKEEAVAEGVEVKDWKDIAALCSELWVRMDDKEKLPFHQEAKHWQHKDIKMGTDLDDTELAEMMKMKADLGPGSEDKELGNFLRNCGEINMDSAGNDIINNWKHPNGKDCVVTVIGMNYLVGSDHIYIPAELGITTFTLVDGILDSYWSLIWTDQIPLGYRGEGLKNLDKYGLPSLLERNELFEIEKTVEEIERFLLKYKVPATGKVMLFCRLENMSGIRSGLDWLYKQSGRTFTHEIYALERLLIVLSAGGLEKLVENTKSDLTSVCHNLVSSIATWSQQSELRKRRRDSMSGLIGGIPGGSMDYYTQLGGECERVASKPQPIMNPYAFLGVFLLEDSVSMYFHNLEYAYVEDLACPHHLDHKDTLIECSLSKVKRLVYQVLDVVLIHYGIKPIRGKHFPTDVNPLPKELEMEKFMGRGRYFAPPRG